MVKLKTLAAVMMSVALTNGAMAAEFAKEMSPVTVELQKAAVDNPVVPAADVDVSTQAEDWLLSKGKTSGFSNGTYIAVGKFSQKTSSRDLSNVRSLSALAAQLDAKVQIARFLNTTASAEIRSSLPAMEPMETPFDKQKTELENELDQLMREYEDALSNVDQEKANQVAGISMEDLYVAGISAALKKHGIDLDIPGLQAESKKKLEELQVRVMTLEARLDSIKKQIAEMAGALKSEDNAGGEVLAEMVLLGVVVVNSWESYDSNTGNYEIAVVAVWSPAQERFMRSVLDLDSAPVKLKPNSSGKSHIDYVRNVDWSRVSGTRWFVDGEGTPHLFAVASEELRDSNPSTKRRAQTKTEVLATSNLALAMYAEVKSVQKAKIKVQTVADKQGNDVAQSVDSVASDMKASVEGLKVVGASRALSRVYPSPFSNGKTFVTVYHHSPLSASGAHDMLNKQLDAANEAGKAQQELKGYIDQGLANAKAARNDAESYARGAATQNARMAEQEANNAAQEAASGRNIGQSSPNGNTRARSTSFGGSGADDFSF